MNEALWVSESRGYARYDSLQPLYNLVERGLDGEMLPMCRDKGVGVIVWSPLAGGWLAGRYRKGEGAASDSRLVRYKERGSPVAKRYDPSVPENERKLDIVEDLVLLAEKAGTTITLFRHTSAGNTKIGTALVRADGTWGFAHAVPAGSASVFARIPAVSGNAVGFSPRISFSVA